MSEEYISRGAVEISIGEKSSEYTKVVVIDKDGKEYSAGTSNGNTLTVNCPWATQDMANSLHAKFNGKTYQSYTARDAYISPDIELGGKVNVAGASSVILKQNTEFGDLMTSTISAPGEEELEHEFEYVTRVDRERIRQSRYFSGALEKVSRNSEEGILEAHKELVAALNREDGAPKDLMAGFDSYVRWDLENNEGYASSKLFAQIGEKAQAEIGVYAVEAEGETRTLAQILADQISLTSRVGNAESALTLKADTDTVKSLDGRVSTVETAQTELVARVDGAVASLEQKAEKKTVQDMGGRIETIESAQNRLSARVDGAEASLEQKADSKTVESLKGRVSSVETAQNSLTARVSSAESSLSQKAEKSTVSYLSGRVDTVETAQTSLTSRVGTAEASLEQKAEKKTVETLDGRVETVETAQTGLSARVDGAVASIELNAKNINGVTSSLATIKADVVKLQGDTTILGNFTVEGGNIRASKGIVSDNGITGASIYANGTGSQGIISGRRLSCTEMALNGKDYTPQQITSTSGAVLALGIA